ncbi:MAG: hypothetical protein GY847_16055 [Proteobacteria bacterium]|nr:hypothetical protein [Pseudomonadota bacterium]
MARNCNGLAKSTSGSVYVEQVVLVSTVALGFAAAIIPLGAMLLNYHDMIEFVFGLPIP